MLVKHALILEPIDPAKKLKDYVLTWLPNVVRVLQLSLSNCSKKVARLIDNSLGEFVEALKESNSYYSSFFRIKVRVDVFQLLKRSLNFEEVDGRR